VLKYNTAPKDNSVLNFQVVRMEQVVSIHVVACPEYRSMWSRVPSSPNSNKPTGMSIGFGAQATYSQPYSSYTNIPPQGANFTSNGEFRTSYSSATPSTSTKQHRPQPSVCAVITKETTSVKKPAIAKRTQEEYEIMTQTSER